MKRRKSQKEEKWPLAASFTAATVSAYPHIYTPSPYSTTLFELLRDIAILEVIIFLAIYAARNYEHK